MLKKKLLFSVLTIAIVSSILANKPTVGWNNIDSQDEVAPTPELIVGNSTSVSIEYTIYGFTADTIIVDGTLYHRISLVDCPVLDSTGMPELPYIKELLASPHCDDYDVSVSFAGSVVYDSVTVYPAPEWVRDTSIYDSDTSFGWGEKFVIDTSYYINGTSDYPSESGELAESGKLRLQPVAHTNVYPFVYDPDDKTFTVHSSVMLTVTFTDPEGPTNYCLSPYESASNMLFINRGSGGFDESSIRRLFLEAIK
ncbi:hypothetical protein KAH81_04570 [bacterium]|nr:hypothetical protein [bacterium]